MTTTHPTSVMLGSSARRRWRTWRWILLAIIVICAVAALSTYLTEPRAGGRMEAGSTSPDGAQALVTLLQDRGVDVVVADNVADVERNARPDTLLLVAQTFYLTDDALLDRLAAVPGDRVLIEPLSATREKLAPDIRVGDAPRVGGGPECDLGAANRAGAVQLGPTDTYEASSATPIISCYDGALVRYRSGGRTVTVVGSSDFMTNGGLLKQGNAALAMNLAGERPRLIWYAPQRIEGDQSGGDGSIFDLIPDQVIFIVWQLWIVVGLIALWKGRRMGPLVAEQLPVVVRASETVEGRGRLYRSRRARGRAADALRTATLQRLTPRLGLGHGAAPPVVVAAVAARSGGNDAAVHHTLYGPPPATDTDLVSLAHELDTIERQVITS